MFADWVDEWMEQVKRGESILIWVRTEEVAHKSQVQERLAALGNSCGGSSHLMRRRQ